MKIDDLLNPWVVFGFAGQAIFFARFLVQWIVSERNKAVTIPVSFWYLSIVGSAVILVYAIHIGDIVFTVAQVLSFFIYIRNLYLLGHARASKTIYPE